MKKLITLVTLLLIPQLAFAITIVDHNVGFQDQDCVTLAEHPGVRPCVEQGLTDEQIIQKLTVDPWGDCNPAKTWVELMGGASCEVVTYNSDDLLSWAMQNVNFGGLPDVVISLFVTAANKNTEKGWDNYFNFCQLKNVEPQLIASLKAAVLAHNGNYTEE